MFEKYLCEEVKNGNCKVNCAHSTPHSFYEGFCNDSAYCPEKDKHVKCVEISMENYI